jgi:dihydrofolate reductase
MSSPLIDKACIANVRRAITAHGKQEDIKVFCDFHKARGDLLAKTREAQARWHFWRSQLQNLDFDRARCTQAFELVLKDDEMLQEFGRKFKDACCSLQKTVMTLPKEALDRNTLVIFKRATYSLPPPSLLSIFLGIPRAPSMSGKFSCVLAAGKNGVIGKGKKLPWGDSKTDMGFFRRLTSGEGKVVIMGRETYFSIPAKFRPLANRVNFVLSSETAGSLDSELVKGVQVFKSLKEALEAAGGQGFKEIFIMGGKRLYEEALDHPDCERIYITHFVDPAGQAIEGDVFVNTNLLPPQGFAFDSAVVEPFNDNGLQGATYLYKRSHLIPGTSS